MRNRPAFHAYRSGATRLAMILAAAVALPIPASAQDGPIRIVWDLHADPIGGSPATQRATYLQHVAAGHFAMDAAEAHAARVSFLTAGQFAEWALEDTIGLAMVRRAWRSGGQIGTHSHKDLRTGPHAWSNLVGDPTELEIDQNWAQHVGLVDALVSATMGETDAVRVRAINAARGAAMPSEIGPRLDRMETWGFDVHEAGVDEEFYGYFGHYVMNPYRPSSAGALAGEPGGPAVLAPTCSVIGKEQVHFGILQDNRLETLQARFFIHLFHWLSDAPPASGGRLWTFGWGSHLHDFVDGEPSRAAIGPMLAWLDEHFIGRPVGGRTCASYASMTDVRDAFAAWELRNPGEASFRYEGTTADWSRYPYREAVTRALLGTSYIEPLPSPGPLRWHRLRSASALPPDVFVAYTVDGRTARFDLSATLGGGVIANLEPATGSIRVEPTTAVTVPASGAILRRPAATAGAPELVPARGMLRLVSANPATDAATLEMSSADPAGARVRVFDAQGRMVRTLDMTSVGGAAPRVMWDLLDEGGRRVPDGLYFGRRDGFGANTVVRIVVGR